MTLDEAIKHAEEVAKKQENNAKSYPKPNKSVKGSGKKYNACLKCAEEHRQLAEWLKDYKRLLSVTDAIKAEIDQHCSITVGSDNEPAMTLHDIFGILDKHTSGKEKEKQYWIFTFGCGQKGAGTAVKIAGTYGEAREKMCNKYGNKWAFQYSEEEWNEYQNDPYLCELETITEVIE